MLDLNIFGPIRMSSYEQLFGKGVILQIPRDFSPPPGDRTPAFLCQSQFVPQVGFEPTLYTF